MIRVLVSGVLVLLASAAADARQATELFTGQIRAISENYCPEGTLQANGQLLPISGASDEAGVDYTELYSLIGCRFGGDCRSTFALPDLRGRMLIGSGRAQHNGQTYQLGQQVNSQPVPATALPSHTHTFNASSNPPTTGNPQGAVPPTRTDSLSAYTDQMPAAGGIRLSPSAIAPTSPGGVLDYHPVLAINYCIVINGVYPNRP